MIKIEVTLKPECLIDNKYRFIFNGRPTYIPSEIFIYDVLKSQESVYDSVIYGLNSINMDEILNFKVTL